MSKEAISKAMELLHEAYQLMGWATGTEGMPKLIKSALYKWMDNYGEHVATVGGVVAKWEEKELFEGEENE